MLIFFCHAESMVIIYYFLPRGIKDDDLLFFAVKEFLLNFISSSGLVSNMIVEKCTEGEMG